MFGFYISNFHKIKCKEKEKIIIDIHTCVLVASFPMIFKKQEAGIIIA